MHLTPKSENSRLRINFTETTSLFSYMSISKIMPKQGIKSFFTALTVLHMSINLKKWVSGKPYLKMHSKNAFMI